MCKANRIGGVCKKDARTLSGAGRGCGAGRKTRQLPPETTDPGGTATPARPAQPAEPGRGADKAARPWPRMPGLPTVSQSLQIMAFVVFAVIVGVTWRQLIQLRTATVEETARQVTRLNMVMAEQTGRAMDTIDFVLRSVTDQIHAGTGEAAMREAVRRQISGVRQLLAVEVADSKGALLLSTRAAPSPSLPPAGQALLERLRTEPAAGLQFSEPLRQDDGSWTVLVAKRIDGPEKAFDGIVIGYLSVLYFEDFYKSVELSENGAILLHRRDGVVLARFPHDDTIYGKSYADLPPFRDILSKTTAGSLEMDSPIDGHTRILAIRALRAFPLAVNVSVDEDRVLAGWRRQTWVFAFSSIGFALVIVGLMFQLARRSHDTQRLLERSVEARAEAEAATRDLRVQMEERERAETALRQSQRVEAVGQLTGGVAHDFNNLLTILLGNIELMQSQPAASSFTQRLNTMRAAAERGAKLTNHLLAFARRQPLMPRSVDLGTLIAGMEPLLASALGTRVRLDIVLDSGIPAIHVDAAQIEMIILNIAINARDAMPNGGTLRITTSAEILPASANPDSPSPGCYVCLRMTDNGIGMPPEVLARAFEPYFSTKPQGTGSGLGLSQVYGIARQSGGQARIESAAGVGTTVIVHLPCEAGHETVEMPIEMPVEVMPERMPDKAGKRATLLVVDDDHAVRSTTAMLLRRSGYTVTEAEGGDAALSILAHDGSIELLITDVVMPKMNGSELAAKASELRPELPILFLSGYADPQGGPNTIPLSRLVRKPRFPPETAPDRARS
eukprot:gene12415-12502_t